MLAASHAESTRRQRQELSRHSMLLHSQTKNKIHTRPEGNTKHRGDSSGHTHPTPASCLDSREKPSSQSRITNVECCATVIEKTCHVHRLCSMAESLLACNTCTAGCDGQCCTQPIYYASCFHRKPGWYICNVVLFRCA